MLSIVRTIMNKISDVLVTISAIGLIVMTLIIGWQVFGRYVLHSSPNWSEQAAVTLMIWYISFAAAAGVREGFHIKIQAVENMVSESTKFVMNRASEVIVSAIGICMAVYGVQLVIATWGYATPTLGISRGACFLAIPISGALIAVFSLERFVAAMCDKNTDKVGTY